MGFAVAPIKFGTDGWRGVIGADFTFERVVLLAPWAAKVLEANYGQPETKSLVIVGYDRRFMAEDFAQAAAEAIQGVGFDVLLSQSYAPTPAFSWAAKAHNAVGAIVLTASHNPARYLGLKVKGAFGGSVAPEITQQIEAMIPQGPIAPTTPGTLELFDPWESYCQGLQPQVDVAKIREAIASGKARVFADAMHGAAATGLERLLGIKIEELNSDRDPLFNGGAPEPLEKNVGEFLATMQQAAQENPEQLRMGLVFDGDCDRIAAADGQGNFLSSQILIPILIEHLAQRHGKTGEVVKTVSGSDLIPKVADLYGLSIHQTPIGYKYIGDRMLKTKVLLGGEESGGIGYGHHIPERDALLSALYVLEAVIESGQDLSQLYQSLQKRTNFYSEYDRIDLPLPNMQARQKLLDSLTQNPIQEVAGQGVVDCLTVDGYKFRLADNRWLLIRFSGTEPVLRLYCEAATGDRVQETLEWARNWANSV